MCTLSIIHSRPTFMSSETCRIKILSPEKETDRQQGGMLSVDARISIVGAGIVGSSTAYYLTQAPAGSSWPDAVSGLVPLVLTVASSLYFMQFVLVII